MIKKFIFILLLLYSATLFSQSHFSASQTQGCDSLKVLFNSNNYSTYTPIPFQTTGYSYHWSFGNSNSSTNINPDTVCYNIPGNYTVNYTCIIDTVGFILTGILVTEVGCTDPFGGNPDPYIIIKDINQNTVFSTEGNYISNQPPPYSWAMNIELANPPYFIWVWDHDSMDADDNCIDNSENQPGASTVLTLPNNNANTFGNSIINYHNGGLVFQAYFHKPVISYTDSVIINVFEKPSPPQLNIINQSYCLGENIPEIIATPEGSNIIKWYNNESLTSLINVGNNILVPQDSIATYYYYATQTNPITECTSNATGVVINISYLEAPILSEYNKTICTGEALPTITASGMKVLWYDDSLLTNEIASTNSITIAQMPIGYYSLYAIQIDTIRNCISYPAVFNYSFIQGVEASFNASHVQCNGNNNGSIITNIDLGSPPFTFLWAHGEYTKNISNLLGGEYILTIIDNNYCISINSIQINEPNAINIDAQIYDALCNNENTGSIQLNVTGGNAPYQYLWSNSFSTNSIVSIGAGLYSVTIVDENNCASSQSFLVSEPDEMAIDYNIIAENCMGSNDGEIELFVNGGTFPYKFIWSNNSINSYNINLNKGVYNVTVTDGNNCTKAKEIILTSVYDFCLEIPSVISPNNDGSNDTWKIRFIEMYPDCIVKVFNRWGQILFDSKGYNIEWDGKFNGKDLPMGSYYYIIDLNTKTEKSLFNGTIDIIR